MINYQQECTYLTIIRVRGVENVCVRFANLFKMMKPFPILIIVEYIKLERVH